MAEQKILISININDKQAKKSADGVAKSLTKVQKAQEALNFELSESGREYAKLTAATNDQKLANNLAAKSAVDMAKGIKAGRTQSGLNNAILLETGRLASDASYGFTAIANNLSQVVSLFGSFVKTQGSVGASLRELGKSIMGTGGLLIGIQLLISFGPKLVDMFMRLMGETMKLSDVFKDASKEVTATAGKFETYTKTLRDSSKSQKEQQDAINSLKKEFPDYIKQLDDAGLTLDDVAKGTKEARKENDIYRESIVKLAMARAAQNKIDEEATKQVQAETDLRITAREKFSKSTEELQKLEAKYEEFKETNTQKGRSREKALTKSFSTEERQILKLIKTRNKEVEEAQKNIDALIEFTDIEDDQNKKSGRSRKKRSRTFKAADLDYEKETQQSQERLLKSFIEDEKTKVAVKFDGIRTRARLKQTEFEEDQQRRLDEFKASDATEAEKAEAQKRFDEEIAKSKESLSAYIVKLKQEEAAAITNIEIEESREIQRLNREKLDSEAAYLDEKNRMNGDYSFFQTERNIKTLGMDLAAQQAVVDSYAIGTIEREQAELRLFELKKQLNSEEQSLAEQKFAFYNQQYTAITDALSQTFAVSAENETIALDESYGRKIAAAEGNNAEQERLEKELAEKKDKIARKQFKIDKAMKIGRALMDTYQSGILAFGSQLIVGDPTSPVRARIAQAVALATGLANVANIARQKYKSSISAGAGGGASGGGGNAIQAPDFNVVGASETSQLAQTVATSESQPIKAFVVGKDISTQQELDRNITNTASFG